jgi:hypothetical protein
MMLGIPQLTPVGNFTGKRLLTGRKQSGRLRPLAKAQAHVPVVASVVWNGCQIARSFGAPTQAKREQGRNSF